MSDDGRDTCPACGGELGAGQLAGICPRCLLRRGLETLDGSTLPVDPTAGLGDPGDAAPEAPGRYTLVGEQARGGMGRVLVVHDEALGRDVALKELLPGLGSGAGPTPTPAHRSRQLAARFLREAKITGQLEHPGVAPVHELGRRADGSLYYTMKLVSGRTLDDAIRAAGSYEARRRLLPHVVDLCQTIAYAHSRGVIHRDLKPSNVLIGEFGETVVVDWGLAKVIADVGAEEDPAPDVAAAAGAGAADATRDGEVMGTPVYMSPEQASGRGDEVDERSDVYSLGAVLYHVLTGVPPFRGDSPEEIVERVRREAPSPVRGLERRVPRELASICERAMAPDREARTPSAHVLAREVERAATVPDVYVNPLRPSLADRVPEVRGLTRLARAVVVGEASRRWRRRNLWPSLLQDTAVGATIVLFAAVAMVAFFALVALARELGLAVRDEVLWVAVTAPGLAVLLVLTRRASTRSLAPHVREVLTEAASLAAAAGPPARRARRRAAARQVASTALVAAMVGAYAGILLMPDALSRPSVVPILLGAALGAGVEAWLLWRSERGPSASGDPGVGTARAPVSGGILPR